MKQGIAKSDFFHLKAQFTISPEFTVNGTEYGLSETLRGRNLVVFDEISRLFKEMFKSESNKDYSVRLSNIEYCNSIIYGEMRLEGRYDDPGGMDTVLYMLTWRTNWNDEKHILVRFCADLLYAKLPWLEHQWGTKFSIKEKSK